MKYCLQRKEQHVFPNILGNKSFPVYSYRWKDIAISDDKILLEQMIPPEMKEKYRIETRP